MIKKIMNKRKLYSHILKYFGLSDRYILSPHTHTHTHTHTFNVTQKKMKDSFQSNQE